MNLGIKNFHVVFEALFSNTEYSFPAQGRLCAFDLVFAIKKVDTIPVVDSRRKTFSSAFLYEEVAWIGGWTNGSIRYCRLRKITRYMDYLEYREAKG